MKCSFDRQWKTNSRKQGNEIIFQRELNNIIIFWVKNNYFKGRNNERNILWEGNKMSKEQAIFQGKNSVLRE